MKESSENTSRQNGEELKEHSSENPELLRLIVNLKAKDLAEKEAERKKRSKK